MKNMKITFIILATGVLVLVFVASPIVEKTPLPHTVEPLFSTQAIPTLVMPFSGSYTPSTIYSQSGSWA
jgi:hypothetical protein